MAAAGAVCLPSHAKSKPLGNSASQAGPCILGIDEAGRGPVLGPMVYAAAFCEETNEAAMRDMAFADSKVLTDEQREGLFANIQGDDRLGYAIESVSAAYISARMLRRDRISLNQIANECTFNLVAAVLEMGYRLSKVYVDTVGDADRHRERLEQRFPGLGISFTVCPKADSIYPIVSAASIVAKVTRDMTLREFVLREQLQLSRSWGSGYPGDPGTKAWLEAALEPLFGFPQVTRFSWQTVSRILEYRGPKVTWACDVNETSQSITAFVQGGDAVKAATSGAKRPAFFRTRKLARVTVAF